MAIPGKFLYVYPRQNYKKLYTVATLWANKAAEKLIMFYLFSQKTEFDSSSKRVNNELKRPAKHLAKL